MEVRWSDEMFSGSVAGNDEAAHLAQGSPA